MGTQYTVNLNTVSVMSHCNFTIAHQQLSDQSITTCDQIPHQLEHTLASYMTEDTQHAVSVLQTVAWNTCSWLFPTQRACAYLSTPDRIQEELKFSISDQTVVQLLLW